MYQCITRFTFNGIRVSNSFGTIILAGASNDDAILSRNWEVCCRIEVSYGYRYHRSAGECILNDHVAFLGTARYVSANDNMPACESPNNRTCLGIQQIALISNNISNR